MPPFISYYIGEMKKMIISVLKLPFITNIHELLPELDLDTLFKIMEAIVEETTPIINWPNSIRTPLSDKPWWEEPNRITCTYNSK